MYSLHINLFTLLKVGHIWEGERWQEAAGPSPDTVITQIISHNDVYLGRSGKKGSLISLLGGVRFLPAADNLVSG